ncbi:MAG TPA: hypothetical protein K8W02_10125, partial [Mediterranea massiliensis]|nr:hypothetical protein [Mediterranea massiliensis]
NSRQSEQHPLPDSYEPLIDKDTIGLIVQLVNEVGLFIEQLDVNDVITRYEKAMLNPVTSKNNTRLVLLLDKLAMHDIIPYDWQSVIAKKQLVRSSSGKKFLNQHDLSSTLNRIKDIQPSISEKKFFATIDRYKANQRQRNRLKESKFVESRVDRNVDTQHYQHAHQEAVHNFALRNQ